MFPARAGMSRVHQRRFQRLSGVPRASGDEPAYASETPGVKLCSPRERG